MSRPKMIICEICEVNLSLVDPEALELPITTDQFPSPMPRNMPEPVLAPGQSWLDMLCPVCGHRPFIYEDRVKIRGEGYYHIGTQYRPPTSAQEIARVRAMADLAAGFVSDADAETDLSTADGLSCGKCGKRWETKTKRANHERRCQG